LGGRPQPQVEGELLRRRGRRLAADAPALLATVAFGDQQPAVLPRLHGSDLVSARAAAALLRTMLHHPAVAAGWLDAAPPLVDVVAEGLFDVDVLACLAGPDRDERVPVIRRGDGDDVEVLVVQGPSNVLYASRLILALIADFLAP